MEHNIVAGNIKMEKNRKMFFIKFLFKKLAVIKKS